MLKLIVQHAPSLVGFLVTLNLSLSRPQRKHVLRLSDAIIVTEGKHKTVASLYDTIVDAPDASNGCDSLRISPWTAEDLRKPLREFAVQEIVKHGEESGDKTVYVSIDDSVGEKDKATRNLEAVDWHHDHTKSTKKKKASTNGTVHVETRLQLGEMSYVYDWRLYMREKKVRRLNRKRPPENRLRFRKKTNLAYEMLKELKALLPDDYKVYVLFDSWYASNRLIKYCRRQGWHVICAIKSNRKFGEHKLSQLNQTLKHRRYKEVTLTATDKKKVHYFVRPQVGRLNNIPYDVCVLISKRHHRDKRPKYFLCTDVSLSPKTILQFYQKRWPIEVDNFYVKQHLGLTDFRVQSFEATEKWFAVVFLTYVFLQWQLNNAPPDQRLRSIADVVRKHRAQHARSLLQTACQEALKTGDLSLIFSRFIRQTT